MNMDPWTAAAALWIALTVVAVLAATWLVVTLARADRRIRRALEERLARGEIDIEDYRTRMALLGG